MHPMTRCSRRLLWALILCGAPMVAQAGTTPWCGAGPASGAGTTNLTCPAGQGIVAIGTTSGPLDSGPVTAIRINCAVQRTNSGGSGYPSQTVWQGGGSWKGWPSSGSTQVTRMCSDGRVMRSLHTYGRPHGLEKVTGAGCAACNADMGFCGQVVQHLKLPVLNPWGPRCDMQCPNDEYLYRLQIRRGAWVDSIRGHCRKPTP